MGVGTKYSSTHGKYIQKSSSKWLIKLCTDDPSLDKSGVLYSNLDCDNIRKCDYPWIYKHLSKVDFLRMLIDWNDDLGYKHLIHQFKHSTNMYLFLDYMFNCYIKNDIKWYFHMLNNVWIMKTKFYSHLCYKWNQLTHNFFNSL
jgi:hypothetical protein